MRWYHVSYSYWCAGGRQRQTWQQVQAVDESRAIQAALRNHPQGMRTTATAVECEPPVVQQGSRLYA